MVNLIGSIIVLDGLLYYLFFKWRSPFYFMGFCRFNYYSFSPCFVRKKMTLSIHQPNFVPRASYFQKIAQSDIFVIMSHCQYSSGAFQNRFNVDGKMYNMVVRASGSLISEKGYKDPERDWRRITTAFPKLKEFDECIGESLLVTNLAIILRACHILKINTPIIPDFPSSLTGTPRLINLCKTFGATRYLSGISGRNYLDLEMFAAEGIEVVFQDEATMDKRPLYEILP